MASREEVLGIIERLRQDPALADELRSVLLTEALLSLPERFAAFVSEVRAFVDATNRRLGGLESEVALVKQDVSVLKQDVSVLKQDVSVLKQDVSVLKDDVGMLKGGHFESRWLRHSAGYMMRHGFFAASPVRQSVLVEAAQEAMGTGALGVDEIEDLLEADAVLVAKQGRNGPAVYLVCEVASRLHSDDIRRVARRAEIAVRLDGTPSVAVAAGASIDDDAAALADREGVAVVIPTSWRRAE
ncbi:MAG: hypothetical protein ACP5P1_13550 [Acidimicrobiales bacterium]